MVSGFTRKDLLEFCLSEKIIGVGWGKINTRINNEDEIKKQANLYSDSTSAIKALNAMREMKIDDLIWTRYEGVYYLCRVTDVWEHSKPNSRHYKMDISNYVNVEWLEIGLEQDIPGKIVNSFRPAASAQKIRNVENISMYIWNMHSNKPIYKLDKLEIDIWSVLSAEEIEELVLLYLQINKKFYVYSTTVKCSFPKYECQLVNELGVHAYPQVKSGNESLCADDYMDAIRFDPKAEIYLFAVSEKYKKNQCEQIHYVYKNELEQFICEKIELLPKITKYWVELCKQ